MITIRGVVDDFFSGLLLEIESDRYSFRWEKCVKLYLFALKNVVALNYSLEKVYFCTRANM